MRVDLHTHTTASDGRLAPETLLARAHAAGVALLAITDHDTVAAYHALTAPSPPDLTLVTGVELSTVWHRIGIHVVGLRVALDSPALGAVLAHQADARLTRAGRIAERLARRGIPDALAGAARCAGTAVIGRPHFAAYLVSIGAVASVEQAFARYLRDGDRALREDWADLATIVRAIREAGGTPVLAHPAKYGLTRGRLDRLAGDFRAAGGEALEVGSGQQRPDVTAALAALADRHALMASFGSDFHQDGQPWAELGKVPAPPPGCRPVWDAW
jgi:predicted metal-dependent phosphoesterase TrpH